MLRRLVASVRAWFAERRYLSVSARWRATMLDYQVHRVLRKEHEDARDKRSSEFWSSGGHNVGQDVLEAVMDAEAALNQLPESDLRLHKALAVLVAAREEYRNKSWDPDGFGVATYHQIIRGFESLQKEYGKRARFSPRAFECDLPSPFGPYRVVYDAPGQKDAGRDAGRNGSNPNSPAPPPWLHNFLESSLYGEFLSAYRARRYPDVIEGAMAAFQLLLEDPEEHLDQLFETLLCVAAWKRRAAAPHPGFPVGKPYSEEERQTPHLFTSPQAQELLAVLQDALTHGELSARKRPLSQLAAAAYLSGVSLLEQNHPDLARTMFERSVQYRLPTIWAFMAHCELEGGDSSPR